MDSQNTIAWQAREEAYEHKDPDWFWAIGIIAVSIAVISAVSGNILFALFVLLGAFTLFLHAIKKPRETSVEIHSRGIVIDEEFFPYDTLVAFDLIEYKDTLHLIFKSKKVLIPYIVVPLPQETPRQENIREYLINYLPEQELEMPLSHRVAEFIGL